MSKAFEFQNTKELVNHLKLKKAHLAEYFKKRKRLEDIIRGGGVGSNIFRAFHYMPHKPSEVYRRWVFEKLNGRNTIKKITSILSEQQYNHWLKEFSRNFCQYWRNKMDIDIPYGPGRKLPDLLMKTFVLWNQLDDNQRTRLIKFLHVPLDSYTLIAIRNCISDLSDIRVVGVIPKNATMGFVINETMYDRIQQVIKNIARQSGVPPIYLDVLAWNERH